MSNRQPDQPVSHLTPVPGLLRVSKANPRYFAVASGSDEAGEKIVYPKSRKTPGFRPDSYPQFLLT
jgi:hypothetical protein